MPEIRIVDVTGQPSGWDIADALAEGWTTAETIAWARARVRHVREPDPEPAPPAVEQPAAESEPPSRVNGHTHEPPAITAEPWLEDHRPEVYEPTPPTIGLIPAPRDSYEDEADDAPPFYVTYQTLGLSTDSGGKPHANLNNASAVIERHETLTGRIWYDEFLQRVLTTWGGDEPEEWSDAHTVKLTLWMQRVLGLAKFNTGIVHDAVMAVAHINKRDEAREWLRSLKWDGTQRVHLLMSEGFGAPANLYTEAVGRYFMCGMVKRVLQPGCKVDAMPVFEGAQGIYKSTALSVLGGKWYAECHVNIQSKDFYGVLQGKMLVEISEMHSFGPADVEAVKGIISCQVDRYRAPYGRSTNDHPRRSVFGGTCNGDEWNRDETGARRFLPIRCGTVSLNWIRDNREQLFAEAVAILRSGEQWWAVPLADARWEQDARRSHDSWEPHVRSWLMGRNKVRIGELLAEAIDLPLAKQGNMEQRRAGRVLRALGWKNMTVREGGTTARYWCAPNYDPAFGGIETGADQLI